MYNGSILLLGAGTTLQCQHGGGGVLEDFSMWDINGGSFAVQLAGGVFQLGLLKFWGTGTPANTFWFSKPGGAVYYDSGAIPVFSGGTVDWMFGGLAGPNRKGVYAELPVVAPLIPAAFTWSDFDQAPIGASINSPALAANVGATLLFSGTPRRGLYRICGAVDILTAGTAGNVVLNVTYTDRSGITQTVPVATYTNLAVKTAGKTGVVVIEADGTDQVLYSVTGIVTPGALSYAIRMSAALETSGFQ